MPLFIDDMCEGFVAKSKDALFLSEIFLAPILVFSVFDSDVLCISYGDKEKNITFDCISSLSGEYEDDKAYVKELPDILLSYCGDDKRQDLMDTWHSSDYIFADDKMADICEILNMDVLYSAEDDDMPEGFVSILDQ
jgi:hypothetical protein